MKKSVLSFVFLFSFSALADITGFECHEMYTLNDIISFDEDGVDLPFEPDIMISVTTGEENYMDIDIKGIEIENVYVDVKPGREYRLESKEKGKYFIDENEHHLLFTTIKSVTENGFDALLEVYADEEEQDLIRTIHCLYSEG